MTCRSTSTLPGGTWFFVIDLPHGRDGKLKQMRRRGFRTEQLASRAEELARLQFSKADLAADGTVAAELAAWLNERELDVALTTLGNYRNALNAYVVPYLGAAGLRPRQAGHQRPVSVPVG